MNVNQSSLGVQMSLQEKGAFVSEGPVIVLRSIFLRGTSLWTVDDSIAIVNATINSSENSTLMVCMIDCQGCDITGSGTLITKCPEKSRNSFVVKLTLNWAGRILSPQNPSYFQQCVITLADTLGANFIGQFVIQSGLVSATDSIALAGIVVLEKSVVLFRSGNGNWKINGTLVLAENCDLKGNVLTFQALSDNSSLELRQTVV